MKARFVSALSALTLIGAVASLGCKDKSQNPAPAPDLPASAQPRVAPAIDTRRALAFDDPKGGSKVDQEIVFYQKVLRKQDDKTDAWILLGRAWVRKARESADPGYYLNANACAEIVLATAPDDYTARDLKALVLLNDHKFEEARVVAKKIVEDRPDDAMGYGSLSDALLELGRFDEAAAAAQKMMDLKPNLPSYGRAAYFRWLQGDTTMAKELERRAIDSGAKTKDPEPRAWEIVQSATIFWHEGDYEGAEAGYDLALQSVTEYAPALAGKGKAALSRNDPKRAAELLARAYAASPLPETAWYLGDARQLAGDAKGAGEAYAKLEKTAAIADPRTLSLYLSTKDKEPARALTLAEAEKKVRGDIATEDALAWALYRNRKFPEAKAASDRALSHGTKDARLAFHAGAIKIALGDAKGGQKQIKDALALNPVFDPLAVVEARRLAGVGP